MTIESTDRLLTDMRSAIAGQLRSCGFAVCKEMVTQDGSGREIECCDDCEGGLAVAVWENQAFPTTTPPVLLPPDPHSSAYVVVHELQFSIATCWPQLEAVPVDNDPREDTALLLARVRDCVWAWLDRCKRKIEALTPDGLDVWNLGERAVSAVSATIECTGWEWTISVW